jgi:medium-chain acyl-[acyl-carrier-protein] hydrolase
MMRPERGWLAPRSRDEGARIRLFCFPYAGVGASVYRDWPKHLPGVDVVRLQPPGREARLHEPSVRDFEELVSQATDAVAREIGDLPYALYGHSLGSLVAFEVAHRLRDREGAGEPAHLILGARRAPRLPSRIPEIAPLSDEELLEALERYFGDGVPEEVAQEPELVAMLLPALRADVEAHEGYAYRDRPLLSCPVTALCGLDDPSVSPEEIEAWSAETTGPFTFALLQAGHFFARDGSPQLFRILSRGLDVPRPDLRPAAG